MALYYFISWFVLQVKFKYVCGGNKLMSYRERIYVDCLTVKNYWGLLTGDDGAGF